MRNPAAEEGLPGILLAHMDWIEVPGDLSKKVNIIFSNGLHMSGFVADTNPQLTKDRIIFSTITYFLNLL